VDDDVRVPGVGGAGDVRQALPVARSACSQRIPAGAPDGGVAVRPTPITAAPAAVSLRAIARRSRRVRRSGARAPRRPSCLDRRARRGGRDAPALRLGQGRLRNTSP
jgi:hypothetical protein